jgi:hypothetical protein
VEAVWTWALQLVRFLVASPNPMLRANLLGNFPSLAMLRTNPSQDASQIGRFWFQLISNLIYLGSFNKIYTSWLIIRVH